MGSPVSHFLSCVILGQPNPISELLFLTKGCYTFCTGRSYLVKAEQHNTELSNTDCLFPDSCRISFFLLLLFWLWGYRPLFFIVPRGGKPRKENQKGSMLRIYSKCLYARVRAGRGRHNSSEIHLSLCQC